MAKKFLDSVGLDALWKRIKELISSIDIPKPSDSIPLSSGEASAGISEEYSRADHVHPKETIDSIEGSKVILTGYEKSTGTNEELVVSETDNANIAIGKLEKSIEDIELGYTISVSKILSSTGLSEDFSYTPGSDKVISGAENISDAIDLLAENVGTLNDNIPVKPSVSGTTLIL